MRRQCRVAKRRPRGDGTRGPCSSCAPGARASCTAELCVVRRFESGSSGSALATALCLLLAAAFLGCALGLAVASGVATTFAPALAVPPRAGLPATLPVEQNMSLLYGGAEAEVIRYVRPAVSSPLRGALPTVTSPRRAEPAPRSTFTFANGCACCPPPPAPPTAAGGVAGGAAGDSGTVGGNGTAGGSAAGDAAVAAGAAGSAAARSGARRGGAQAGGASGSCGVTAGTGPRRPVVKRRGVHPTGEQRKVRCC